MFELPAGIAIGLVIGLLPFAWLYLKQRRSGKTADAIVVRSRQEADTLRASAQRDLEAELSSKRDQLEKELQTRRQEQLGLESRLAKKEDGLDRKFDLLNKKESYLETKEKGLNKRTQAIETREQELEQLVEEEKQVLFRITELGKEEAEKLLLQKLEKDFEHEKETLIARTMERVKETVDLRSRDILATCMQRLAPSYCQEITTSVIAIPNDEMKGRVIGREGRNIRAFEKATGVDVIVDDTPGVIIVSCFDSIRREMARRSMEKLIADGRIHPARIEELVEQTKKEMNELIQQEGKQVVYDLNIPGIHPKVVTLLGRLKFRTSYGQNVLHHTKECAYLAGMIAGELGLDVTLARRCALLHDVGKAVDHEIEGGHPEIGANIARRYEEPPEVVNAIASHHNDVPQ
jgi:ribonuclease Y